MHSMICLWPLQTDLCILESCKHECCAVDSRGSWPGRLEAQALTEDGPHHQRTYVTACLFPAGISAITVHACLAKSLHVAVQYSMHANHCQHAWWCPSQPGGSTPSHQQRLLKHCDVLLRGMVPRAKQAMQSTPEACSFTGSACHRPASGSMPAMPRQRQTAATAGASFSADPRTANDMQCVRSHDIYTQCLSNDHFKSGCSA